MASTDPVNVALTIPRPGTFELVERPFPVIQSGYAVVKTEIAPICLEGSRIWAEHDFEFHDDPEHLGHEGVGTVVEVKPGSNFRVGDRVIVFQGDHCGHCHACTSGMSPTYCDANDPDVMGVDKAAMRGIELGNGSASGGFAMEYYRIAPEANLALSVTGIAGPGGGSAEKPVGLVHFSCQRRDAPLRHAAHIFPGNRGQIRQQAVKTALMVIGDALD